MTVTFSPWYVCASREVRRSYSSNRFTMSALEGCELSALGPNRFTPYKEPGPVVQGVGLASGSHLDGHEKFQLHRNLISGPSVV
jgi:hypothetical protein